MPEGISTNILADRLARLQAADLIRRTPASDDGRRSRYEFTQAGAELVPVVQAMARWGEANLPERWTPPPGWYAAEPKDFAP
jgi:DNA-binding HxlR family transcriptional regulator